MANKGKPVSSHPWRHGYMVPSFTPMTRKGKYDMGIREARPKPLKDSPRSGDGYEIFWSGTKEGALLWYLFPELVTAKDIEENL